MWGPREGNHATLATAIAASSPWRSTSLQGILGSGGRWHHSGMTASAVRRVALRKADRVALVILILAGLMITGDSVVDGDLFAPKPGLPDDPSYGKVAEVLRRMRAPLGVWAVRGNWENVRHARDERAFYAAAGVRLLVNESAQVRDDFWLVGLDDADSGGCGRGPSSEEPAGRSRQPDAHALAGVLHTAARVSTAGVGRTHARWNSSSTPRCRTVVAVGEWRGSCPAGTPRARLACSSAGESGRRCCRSGSAVGPSLRSSAWCRARTERSGQPTGQGTR